jgi:hypothetical protein
MAYIYASRVIRISDSEYISLFVKDMTYLCSRALRIQNRSYTETNASPHTDTSIRNQHGDKCLAFTITSAWSHTETSAWPRTNTSAWSHTEISDWPHTDTSAWSQTETSAWSHRKTSPRGHTKTRAWGHRESSAWSDTESGVELSAPSWSTRKLTVGSHWIKSIKPEPVTWPRHTK